MFFWWLCNISQAKTGHYRIPLVLLFSHVRIPKRHFHRFWTCLCVPPTGQQSGGKVQLNPQAKAWGGWPWLRSHTPLCPVYSKESTTQRPWGLFDEAKEAPGESSTPSSVSSQWCAKKLEPHENWATSQEDIWRRPTEPTSKPIIIQPSPENSVWEAKC